MNDGTTVAGPADFGQVTFTSSGNTTHVDLDYTANAAVITNSKYDTRQTYTVEQARTNAREHREFAQLMDRAANRLEDNDGQGSRRYHVGEVTFASNGNVTTIEYTDLGGVIVTDSQGARHEWAPDQAARLAEDHAALVHMLLVAVRAANAPF